jgi:hypothetical protein
MCPPVAQLGASARHFHRTTYTVWETHGVLGQGDIRFLFCQVLGPVNRRVNWKLGRDVEKTLNISDNQGFHGLIIKPFDNQTVSLP